MKNFITLSALFFALSVQAQPQTKPKSVEVDAVIETKVVPTMPLTGNVFSLNDIQFTAAVSGQLKFITEPGTTVESGDVVAEVDTSALDLQLQEQQALIQRAEVQLRYLETNLNRQKDLIKKNSVSANSVEQIESQRDVAASDLAVAKIRVQQIQDQIEKSVIKAQHKGVVTQRLRREGETVAAGTILGSLMDTKNLEVRIQLPLRYSSFVQQGEWVKVHSYGNQIQGQVKSILPNGNHRNQAYEMRVAVNAEEGLKIGQLVSVAVPIQKPQNSLVVHQDAVVLRQEGSFVYRVNSENKVEKIFVETSTSLDHFIAVKGDLKPGDQIVIRGAESLQEGNEVTVNAGKAT